MPAQQGPKRRTRRTHLLLQLQQPLVAALRCGVRLPHPAGGRRRPVAAAQQRAPRLPRRRLLVTLQRLHAGRRRFSVSKEMCSRATEHMLTRGLAPRARWPWHQCQPPAPNPPHPPHLQHLLSPRAQRPHQVPPPVALVLRAAGPRTVPASRRRSKPPGSPRVRDSAGPRPPSSPEHAGKRRAAPHSSLYCGDSTAVRSPSSSEPRVPSLRRATAVSRDASWPPSGCCRLRSCKRRVQQRVSGPGLPRACP